jgi:type IV pilus assembly protein PilY1
MKRFTIAVLLVLVGTLGHHLALAQTMNSYTSYPPFINKNVPPAVMLMMTKDHRLFFKGYNDIVDLDGATDSITGLPTSTPAGTPNGIEATYADYIDYVGYFDPKKCYAYASSGVAGFTDQGRFNPAAAGTGTYGHYCTAQWSGNFLNWATMARIDIIRKVLYGGRRIQDDKGSATSLGIVGGNYGVTVLGRTMTPRDAHSWAKVYAGADLASLVPTVALGIGTAVTICNTNSKDLEVALKIPVGMMMVLNGNFPDAASTNGKECFKKTDTDTSTYDPVFILAGTPAYSPNPLVALYRVAVKVCDPSVGLESNCDTYYDDNLPSPTGYYTYKPQGLIQRMSVNTMGSTGTSDDTTLMRFALTTGSYGTNFSGGVLRSTIIDLYSQEINQRTGQISNKSKVIKMIDMFRVVGYSFPTTFAAAGAYSLGGNDGQCLPSGGVAVEGDATTGCRSWGEPFAEMFYETIRYFRGLAATGNATTQFYGAAVDNNITSYAMGVGTDGTIGSTTFPVVASASYGDPYTGSPAVCEYCAKPFVLMFGDAFPSHDSDQLPGAQAWTQAPSQVNPSPNDTGLSLSTLLTNSQMNTIDPITSVIVGDIGGTTNSLCSAKATTTYLNIRGLCPEEPNKYGTYYLPMLAHYAKTTDLRGPLGNDTTNSVQQNITTYAVVASAPVPIMSFTVGGKTVQLNPTFHSGCPAAASTAPASDPNRFGTMVDPNKCTAAGTGGWFAPGTQSPPYNGNKGQLVGYNLCPNDADWTTEKGNGYTSCYEIQWDDATYGGDLELDLKYRLYIKTGVTTITVKTKPLLASAGNGDWAGYFINGVSGGGAVSYNTIPALGGGAASNTGSGEYYDIRCGNNITGNQSGCQPYFGGTGPLGTVQTGPYTLAVERTFTVTGSNAGLLNDPLWYASKYGGFKDSDKIATPGYNLPDKTIEWDADGNGVPDTYFLAQNPLQLESKLASAFAAILNQTSSGTAASVLSSSTTGEGAIYQSYFYPSQVISELEVKYAGYVQSLFVDTYGNFREDTVKDNRLVLTEDRIVVTRYDALNDRLAIDIYVDANGDGKADPTRDTNADGILDTAFCDDSPNLCDMTLNDINPIWEGGRNLALMSPSSRKILTWVDLDNNKLVQNLTPPTGAATEEYISFDSTNLTKVAGYLNLGATPTAPYTAANLIDFMRGTQVTGLRNRILSTKDSTGASVTAVWKLGDSVYSTPVVIGAPRERYDLLYGDASYSAYYSQYQTRRQVAYLGANDGMMHAINVGVYHQGDDTTTTTKIEHGWYSNTTTSDGRGVNIGDELWAFIPQELLPHLRWLADPAYTHVSYVDLKPKVTDVRIFTPDADHPNGWGTILIGGFRMGGSCGICTTLGQAMSFTADFNGNAVADDAARTFLSAYFVLDVTNPEKVPTLLWSFSDTNLGFTTSYPAVARVSPLTDLKTDNTNAKWFMVVGSGPTNYDAGVGQTGKMFAVNIKDRMTSTAAGVVTVFDASGGGATPPNSFVGDLAAFDRDLDYRTDVIYGGKVISATPWQGKLIRLMTGCWSASSPVCQTNPGAWGVPSGTAGVQAPSEVLYQFLDGGGTTNTLGPVPAAVGVATDQTGNTWVFAGTGRYYTQVSGTGDKIDTSTQYLVGIKDSVLQGSGGCADATITGCRLSATLSNQLIDMSTATICQLGSGTCTGTGANQQVTSVPAMAGGGTYASLLALVASKQGWVTKLTVPSGGLPSERAVANPVVLGGIVFFPTFTPSGDSCVAAGASNLYALYYVTGGAYSSPIIGMTGQNINSKTSLGEGVSTTLAIHLGAQGNGTTGGGSTTGVMGCSQSSTGAINCVNTGTASSIASHFLSWINRRD